jgi:hypothetical protein
MVSAILPCAMVTKAPRFFVDIWWARLCLYVKPGCHALAFSRKDPHGRSQGVCLRAAFLIWIPTAFDQVCEKPPQSVCQAQKLSQQPKPYP